jgi:Domain of unknown function (DUF4375)
MTTPIDEILAEPDDSELCNRLHGAILGHHGSHVALADLSDAERVVVLVMNALGIIGNGGFRYLLEGDLRQDPDLARTTEAFQLIGCEPAVEAFQETLAIFPDSRPPRDIDQRLHHYLTHVTLFPTDQDVRFCRAQEQIETRLASYIRSHADSYRHLEPTRRPPDDRELMEEPGDKPSNDDLATASLPHWKRVAFAARCARRVFPLLTRFWPDIPGNYPRSVLRAIELAEQSAAQEEPAPGLRDATIEAAVTAGAALATRPEYAQDEPRPLNALDGSIASSAAKAAEKAARAAACSPDESAFPALEAWSFAHSAASTAEDEELIATLNQVLAQIRPADDESAFEPEEVEFPRNVARGQRLFFAFALPLAGIEVLGVVLGLARGLEQVNWWKAVIVPLCYLVVLFCLWRGESWARWLVSIGCLLSGGTRLLVVGSLAVELARFTPPEAVGFFVQVVVRTLGLLALQGLVEFVAGLVYLLSPSVRAFLKHQREVAERGF